MRPRLTIAVCLALIASPGLAQAQRAVYLVRHAEKASDTSDPSLTPDGAKRAKTLARMLKSARVDAIYVSDARRTQETAKPLATALCITPVVIADGDSKKTFDAIRKDHADGVVLVVGHSDTVPDLVKLWAPGADADIQDAEFDKLFVVVPRPSGPAGWAMFRYKIDPP
jgi:broad specificity phosphatase PhoE